MKIEITFQRKSVYRKPVLDRAGDYRDIDDIIHMVKFHMEIRQQGDKKA